MKIKVKLYNNQTLPIINEKGDWFDIPLNFDLTLEGPNADILKRKQIKGEEVKTRNVNFYPTSFDLDFSMQLPKGFEAVVLPRSSTFKKYGIVLSNSQGVIDNSYCGNNDTWKAVVIPYKTITIPEGTRLFQFRIQLSQRANIWQKLRWLFWNGKVTFVAVDDLDNTDRGGFGSTGN